MTVLSYHKFVEEPSAYPFSRTYEQFSHDIRKKQFDLITIDDCHRSQIRACFMMTDWGIRAKLFCCTSLIGQGSFCTWDDLRMLSKHHDIECHGLTHEYHNRMFLSDVTKSIKLSTQEIADQIGRRPTHFVAPYNNYNLMVDWAAKWQKLETIKDRVDIRNNTK